MTGELVELVREGLLTGLVVIAPVLAVGLGVGLVCGLAQAATGVQEPLLGLVPRLAAMAATILLLLPWAVERLADMLRDCFSGP